MFRQAPRAVFTTLKRGIFAVVWSCALLAPAIGDTVDPHGWSLAPPSQPLLDEAKNAAHRRYQLGFENYVTPNVNLIDAEGHKRSLKALLDSDTPTILQFIFTTCATTCPVLTASVVSAQGEIAKLSSNYQIVSISIDPEYDTPQQLQSYALRTGAGGNWTFLTGSSADIRTTLKAFDALNRGDNKMYHQPYTYIRARPGRPWTRIDGLISARNLVDEFRAVLNPTASAR